MFHYVQRFIIFRQHVLQILSLELKDVHIRVVHGSLFLNLPRLDKKVDLKNLTWPAQIYKNNKFSTTPLSLPNSPNLWPSPQLWHAFPGQHCNNPPSFCCAGTNSKPTYRPTSVPPTTAGTKFSIHSWRWISEKPSSTRWPRDSSSSSSFSSSSASPCQSHAHRKNRRLPQFWSPFWQVLSL